MSEGENAPRGEPTVLVTGGAGFIGSNLVRSLIKHRGRRVLVLDKLTYAGHRVSLEGISSDRDLAFVQGDIADRPLLDSLLQQYQPCAILNLAAESHVDRSIDGPDDFVRTNVVGTFTLLEAARNYLAKLAPKARSTFRFLQVSTDEVYGSLNDETPFTESSPLFPSSPYSASKASADHFVRAAHRTFGLPTLTVRCSNNYGPYQLPEKLIPRVVQLARRLKPIPIYGDGQQIRDWIRVEESCIAIQKVLENGRVGEVYNVGGNCQLTNNVVVRQICECLDMDLPRSNGSYADLIQYVADRPGHDRRYALDCRKIASEIGWQPTMEFSSGLRATVRWYLDHQDWVERVTSESDIAKRHGDPARSDKY